MFAHMNLYEADQYIKEQLAGIYDPGEALTISSLVIESVSGYSLRDRLLQKENQLNESQQTEIRNMVARLKKNEPIQYIMHKSWFYKMELYIDEHVLIPRPETEELVDWVVQDVIKSGKAVFDSSPGAADETTQLKILDVGTGSGCIALALKKAIPQAEVWGCDISDEALSVARRNGSDLDIRVDFQALDFLDDVQQKQLPAVDIIISNPPYVPLQERLQMAPHVVNHEPHLALFVPDDDVLIFYKAMARFGRSRLHPKGFLYMEIHETHAKDIVNLFTRSGYKNIELRKDMQGKKRLVKVGQ